MPTSFDRGPRTTEPPRGDLAVVERDHPIVEDLEAASALAGDHDGIAGTGHRQRQLDRATAVGVGLDSIRPTRPRMKVVEDLGRVFAPRIVRGEDHAVGPRPDNGRNPYPLAAIAMPLRPDDADHLSRPPFSDFGEGDLEFLGGARGVDPNLEVLGLLDPLGTARNPIDGLKALDDLRCVDPA